MEQTKTDAYRFFKEATLRICGSLDVQEALDAFREYIFPLIPAEKVSVIFFDESTSRNILLGISANHPLPHPPYLESSPYTKEEWNILKASLLRDAPTVLSSEYAALNASYQLVNQRLSGVNVGQSSIGLILILKGELIGVVFLQSRLANQFTCDHAKQLHLLHEPFCIAMANWRRHRELVRLQKNLQDDCRFFQRQLHQEQGDQLIGAAGGLKPVVAMSERVAATDSPVMLLGETGVGKEVIATAIHNASPRKDGPFIKVNCGAIPDGLVDSELFGHEKGAFTGADRTHRGRFERAAGGTLFLDEVGELPLHAQVRLLRVIQTRELERVGGTQSIPVDVRIISATHRDMDAMVAAGDFRRDLWFRLNVFPISIPPLRNRSADIPDLARYFVETKMTELKRTGVCDIPDTALTRLIRYPWPGNVRELQNVVERELILYGDGPLLFRSLVTEPECPSQPPPFLAAPPVLPLDAAITAAIQAALDAAGGKVQGKGGAAELLRMNPNTLRARMRKMGIPYGRGRSPA